MLLFVPEMKIYLVGGYAVKPYFYGDSPIGKFVNTCKGLIERICRYIGGVIKIACPPENIAKNGFVVMNKHL